LHPPYSIYTTKYRTYTTPWRKIPTDAFVCVLSTHTHTHTTNDIHVYNINAFTFGLSPLFRTLAHSLSHYTSTVAVFINGRTLLLHFDNRIQHIYIYDIFPTVSLWAYTSIRTVSSSAGTIIYIYIYVYIIILSL